MFTKVVVAAALTAAIATVAPTRARADFDVGVGVGFGFYGGDHHPGYYPAYGGYYDGISCGTAKKIVKNHGFYKVYATDCSGRIMGFKGKKKGEWYRVKVNRSGDIVDIDDI
jgi:hypothetical protein